MTHSKPTTGRRSLLKAVGGLSVVGLAGCTGGGDTSDGGDSDGDSSGTGGTETAPGTAAEAYPTKPITNIVAGPAGAALDAVYRAFDPHFQKHLGVNTTLQNREGVETGVMMDYLSRQPSDGYTIGVNGNAPTVLAPELYDTEYSVETLGVIGTVMRVNFSLVSNSWSDLENFVNEASDGDFKLGSVGVPTTNNFSAIMSLDGLGVDAGNVTNIPYPGSPDVVSALVRGDVSVGSVSALNRYKNTIVENDLKVLFVNTALESHPVYPDTPTIATVDADIPELPLGVGMFTPPDVSSEKLSVLESALQAGVEEEKFQGFAEKLGIITVGLSGQETRESLASLEDASRRYVQLVETRN